MTLEVAAKALDMNRFTLARLESGANKMDVHIARSMMDVYDCYDSGLLDEVRKAVPPGWWTKFGIQDRGYIGMETEASHVSEFSLVNVPGLLQTEEYTRALLGLGLVERTADQLANQIAARQVRRRRLVDDEHPIHLTAIIDEAVLHRQVGGRDVMAAQLDHLVEASALPTVRLRVLPFEAGGHVGMDGAFTIVSFPLPQEPDIGYVTYPTGAIHIEQAGEVGRARMIFDHLGSRALAPAESIRLVEQVRRRYQPD